jgi:hypothetical protein
MTSRRPLSPWWLTSVLLLGAVLSAQQPTMTPAEQQRRRDLEAELNQIAVVERRVMIPCASPPTSTFQKMLL